MNADKVNEPLLLIHAKRTKSGTFPSNRETLSGRTRTGGTVLAWYPAARIAGYTARESTEHTPL